MNNPIHSARKNNQQGAILIVALIMLLLLTIIGLSSMRGTSLQERMTGNMRDSNLSLQAAEAALRKGEQVASSKLADNSLGTLEAAPLSGTYTGFSGVSAAPTYTITLIALQRTSTAAGEPANGNEGAIVRVEATGSGASTNVNASASSTTTLRSTFQAIEN
jgi:type IV pilus assembly protein PilX